MDELVGTWRLVGAENRCPDGTVTHTFGPDAQGYLIYTAQGVVSPTISSRTRLPFASADRFAASALEWEQSARNYLAYCGHFEVRGTSVFHHVEMSMFPNWIGTRLKRMIDLDGNRLTLSTTPFVLGTIQQTAHLSWERI